MDGSDLINFSNDSYAKTTSPLLKDFKYTESTRLSDYENNPFAVTSQINDPFDYPCEKSEQVNEENKENVSNLLSPFTTPAKSKKFTKLSTSPLYLTNDKTNAPLIRKDFENVYLNLSTNSIENDNSSLQCLNDSFIENVDFEEENVAKKQRNSLEEIDINGLSIASGDKVKNYFNSYTSNFGDISKITTGSCLSNEATLNKGIVGDTLDSTKEEKNIFLRRSLSAIKFQYRKSEGKDKLNSSFSGFRSNYNNQDEFDIEETYDRKCDASFVQIATQGNFLIY